MKAASCPYIFKEWQIIESEFNPELFAQSETIFTTGNGYIGMRGNFEEGTPCFFNGTYLNGFYESTSINYPLISLFQLPVVFLIFYPKNLLLMLFVDLHV